MPNSIPGHNPTLKLSGSLTVKCGHKTECWPVECEWVMCFPARSSWQNSLISFFAPVPCVLVEWGELCRLPWEWTGRGCPPLPGHTAGLYFLDFRAGTSDCETVLDNGMSRTDGSQVPKFWAWSIKSSHSFYSRNGWKLQGTEEGGTMRWK